VSDRIPSASDGERRDGLLTPLLFALVMLCAAALVAACPDLPLVPLPAFIPVYGTVIFICGGLTAYLLSVRYRASHEPSHAALAAAYAFSAMIVLLQTLDFPGVILPEGLFGLGGRGAVATWLLWHAGYSVFVAVAVMQRRRAVTTRRRTPNAALLLGLGCAAVAIACAAYVSCCGALAGAGASVADVDVATVHPAAVAVVCLQLSVLAALVAVTRCRTALEQWLAVALLAGVVDLALGLVGAARFSAGWYLGRVFGMVTSSVVLGVLLWEFGALYRRIQEANRKLLHLATVDALTGLPNRRYLDEQLAIEVRRCEQAGVPLALGLVDVDHFKAFNDRHGHAAGDECLVAAAEELQRGVRGAGGFIARYGGEEFVVVFPGVGEMAARARAEALRAGVAALRLPARDGIGGVVTVSIGLFISAPDGKVDAAGYLVRADQALYQAKRDGRNRVCVWHQSGTDTLHLAVA
jgi:diguanylate cyclase (GGDEF)-like protein